MTECLELGQHQCRALVRGQSLHVQDEIAQILAALDLDRKALGRRVLELGHRMVAPTTQDRVAAIASDGEQPRA